MSSENNIIIDNKREIKILKESKDFYKEKNNLENTFNLYVLYDKNDNNWDKFWIGYFKNLLNHFPLLSIYICAYIPENKNLFQIFLGQNNNDNNPLNFPYIALAVPHHTEALIFGGVSPFPLFNLIKRTNDYIENELNNDKKGMFNKISTILSQFPVIVFIKGTPNKPFCKFSEKFVNILKENKVKYEAINIFEDEKLRCFLRFYQGWKTFPQLYVNGKIVGGVDVLEDIVNKGELRNIIPKNCFEDN